MTCSALVNPTIVQMIWCGFSQAFGSEILLVIIMFCIFLYGIHTFRLPYTVFVPISLMLLFVFAGAGTGALGGLTIFTDLLWFALIIIGAIIALYVWGFKNK